MLWLAYWARIPAALTSRCVFPELCNSEAMIVTAEHAEL